MPTFTRLSQAVYEKLGDEVTNQLVDWMNLCDAAFTAELRERTELNFARFEAKLEQQIAGLRAVLLVEIGRLAARLEAR